MKCRSFSRAVTITRLVALLGVILVRGETGRAAEEPVQADPFKVNETPFGRLGLSTRAYFIGMNHLVGGTPSTPWLVYLVVQGSPADRAGMAVGDQIMAIDGEPVSQISQRRFRKILGETAAGSSIALDLHNEATGVQRRVTLKFESGKTWGRNPQWAELMYGGLRLRVQLPTRIVTHVLGDFPRRPKGIWRTGKQVVSGLAAHGHILRLTQLANGSVTIETGRDGKNLVGEFGPNDQITLKADGTAEVTRRASAEDAGVTTPLVLPRPSGRAEKPKR